MNIDLTKKFLNFKLKIILLFFYYFIIELH